ncbi:dephospho-CoA kinase [Polynucleobacter sp. 30F-ANTBAC]|uniref:dephospho-CoA kinase n=1 Tax=Polynucleobacter sp. 30F-ANTBAC TaxID=2689095 RepID=UPI001C0D53B3|nr:dephospho-CoA kinase [Polynucleobacter sp. 30F-ANTBAC]MBU3599795.1 dephospho-CoA kinase [Polynucleobacter sp. 30F-ANTBAC]
MNISTTLPSIKAKPTIFRVGLTGGIGSGKSAAAHCLEKLGAKIIDFDKIAHEITGPNGQAMPKIAEVFGSSFILPNGALNREKMRHEIFHNSGAKARLEEITHPLINQISDDTLEKVSSQANSPYVVFVVPLFFESGTWYQQEPPRIDLVVVVDCPEELQLSRVQERSHLDKATVLQIMGHQIKRADRLKKAQFIIENDKGLDHLEMQCLNLHNKILQKTS